jgi:hypothetical protein
MPRPTHPLWLAQPSRFARLRHVQARVGLAIVAALLVACLAALGVAEPAPASGGGGRQTDVALYDSIVAGVRHGGGYYAVAADALRAGSYPLRPFVTFRLPGLAVVQAMVPPWALLAMLYSLAAAVALAWYRRLRQAFARPVPLGVALFLLAGGMLAFVQAGLIGFHEIWAAQFVALSLALRRPGRWIEAVALALVAMLIRETAALYVLVMGAIAWLEGERREALGWAAAIAVFAAALAAHAWAVAGVTGPLDAASPGWAGMHGFGLFVKSVTLATALQLVPPIVSAPLVGLALLGWAAWRDPLALRAVAIFTAYAVAIALFARLDTFYWGLMVAPIFLIGLAFAPDALRDLVAAALDRRRVRVQRVAR